MSADKDSRIAELEDRNKRLEDCLVHERTRVADLILANENLKQKLAEQQAEYCKLHDAAKANGVVFTFFQKQEELNNLLAKAKEEGRKEEIPEGWKAVPILPTDEMMLAAEVHYSSVEYTVLKSTYRAMVLAAPKPQGRNKCLI